MDDTVNLKFFSGESTILDYARAAIHVGLWESEKKLITENIPKSAQILELGAGAGRVSLGLAQLGYERLCITDFAPPMVEIAKNLFEDFFHGNSHASFQVEDATALSFPDEIFDAAIFAFNGLQMIPKKSRREQAIAEIARVLKPQGYFIFTGHDRTHPLREHYWQEEKIRWQKNTQDPALDEFGDNFYETPCGKVFIHSALPEEVQASLEKHGFKVQFTELRSRIANEPLSVREFSDDTRFWVAKKIAFP